MALMVKLFRVRRSSLLSPGREYRYTDVANEKRQTP